MSPFDGLSPFTAPSVAASALQTSATRFLTAMIAGSVSLFGVVTSALHISATRFLNAMIASSVSLFGAYLAITKQVNESHRSLNCPRFFNAFLQCDTAHDVMMPVFFYPQCTSLMLLTLFVQSQPSSFS